MFAYIVRRLLLVIPTLFGIMILNFLIVQAAPGGPVEQVIAQIRGTNVDATARITGTGSDTGGPRRDTGNQSDNRYRGARGIDPRLIQDLERQFGFDRPWYERFVLMMGNYARFDFGNSFFRDRAVVDLVRDKIPVSISLGLITTLLIYLISIPLGIRKAVRDGSRFDFWSSAVVIVGNAIPSYLFAILLIVLFAGGSFLQIFPLRGLVSDDYETFTWGMRIVDRLWHLVLPITAMVISGFAGLTMLTKNSFLDEIAKQYVVTARAKGLTEHQVLYGHVFRNAMLLIIAGFPAAFVGILFSSNLLIEIIFSLDGLGLLGFEAALNRDYAVMFGTLYFFTLLGLVMTILRDLTYHWVDPRISFERR